MLNRCWPNNEPKHHNNPIILVSSKITNTCLCAFKDIPALAREQANIVDERQIEKNSVAAGSL